MAQNETARASVYLDGKQAEAALTALSEKAKKLTKELEAAIDAGDNIKYDKLRKELTKVEAAQRSVKKESFDVERVLKNINKVSWKDLEKAQSTIINQLKRMERGTADYAARQRDLRRINTELAANRAGVASNVGMWSMLANGANKYFNIAMAGLAALTGVAYSFSQFIKGMVGLDDALADVMKTTDMARKEVRELYVEFSYLNTRTPRRELLLLAEEAGRLGRKSKRDVMDFVEVANQIKVSLGDDLGGNAEEAIREVGKLTEIYRVGAQYGTGFKESMSKVGSGINEVAASSNAQAPYLIEYMKRLGGVAIQAKISAAEILGYASTFDQLGQNVEMAATAQSKIILDMFTTPGKYAQIARMETEAFAQLLKTDANEAFIKFLEGLNGNNEGLSEMATKLDELGIDGARATQALAALSSNVGKLRTEQETANRAMSEGTSLAREYATKNESLAGSWAKITQWINAKFINSGFLGFMEKIIGATARWIAQPVEAKLRAEQSELNVLIGAITNANTTQQNRNDLIKELQEKYPDFLGNLNSEKATNEELRTRLEDVNKQYEDRILLMIKEDALQQNYKARMDLKIQELDLLKQLAAQEAIAAKAKTKIGTGQTTDPNAYRNLLTAEETNALLRIPLITSQLESNRKATDELIASEQALNNAIGQLRKNRSGETTSETTTTTPVTPTVATPAGGSGKRGKRESQLMQYRDMLLQMAKADRDFTKLQGKELDIRKKQWQKQSDIVYNEVLADIATEKEARLDLMATQLDIATNVVDTLVQMAGAQTELGKALFLFGRAIAIAEIWIKNAASNAAIMAEALAMFAYAGPAAPALATAWAAAPIAANNSSAALNTGLIVAQSVASFAKGKKEGGYTGWDVSDDTPMGIYHANEFFANAKAVRNPTIKPVLDIIDYAQRSGSVASLNLQAAMAGKKDGGYTTPPTAPAATTNHDPELRIAINRLNVNLEKGIKSTVAGYGGKGSVADAIKEIMKLGKSLNV